MRIMIGGMRRGRHEEWRMGDESVVHLVGHSDGRLSDGFLIPFHVDKIDCIPSHVTSLQIPSYGSVHT